MTLTKDCIFELAELPQNETLQKVLAGLAIIPGSPVRFERKMPFGGSYIIKTDNGRFALRREVFESLPWILL